MKLHVAGTYGNRSFGDDCHIAILAARLKAVLGADMALDRVNPEPFSPSVQDGSVLAGTGLVYSHVFPGGQDSLRHFLRYPAAMQLFDKPTALLAVGVQGSLEGEVFERYRPVFERMNLRTARDRESARRLRNAGLSAPVLESADLAYLTAAVAGPTSGAKPKPVLGVVAAQPDRGVIYPRADGFEEEITTAVRSLERDFELRFFQFADADDWLPKALGRSERFVYAPGRVPDERGISSFSAALGEVDVLVSSRFHGIVFAAAAGIPFVGMGAPGEKNAIECDALGYPLFLPYTMSASDLTDAVESAWSERARLRELLRVASSNRRRLAERTWDALGETIARSAAPSKKTHRPAGSPLRRGDSPALVVWAAPASFAEECGRQLSALAPFDVVSSPHARLEHPGIARRHVLPEPGIVEWAAFPPDLAAGLSRRYGRVVVCHARPDSRPAESLIRIAARAATGADADLAELRLWTQTMHPIDAASIEKEIAAGVSAT